MGICVGIDLGTTNSAVAYVNENNQPVILKNSVNESTTPSAIYFGKNGNIKIGKNAKNMEEFGESEVASFYKRNMNVEEKMFYFQGKEYSPIDLSAIFLKELVLQIENKNNVKIDRAIITVPAYFSEIEKQNTRKAAEKAGIDVIKLINEPTAAAIAYGFKGSQNSKNVMIYDLGGGTFDVTIAKVYDKNIDVIAVGGNHVLGGKDWDENLCDYILEKYYDESGNDYRRTDEVIKSLMVTVEKIKKRLTEEKEISETIEINGEKFQFNISEEEFAERTCFLLEKTMFTIDEMFKENDLRWNQIDDVILVGGSTRMNMVIELIRKVLGKEPLYSINPDEAVAMGAAIQAKSEKVRDERLSLMGKKRNSLEVATGKRGHIEGEIVVRDVISHSLGMISISEDGKRYMNDIMIKKNTKYDKAHYTKKRQLNVSKNISENEMDIYLLQGDAMNPLGCEIVKKYVFYDIEYVNGGVTKLNITFYHNDSGTVEVEAIQTENNKTLKYRQEKVEEDLSWLEEPPLQNVSGEVQKTVIYMAVDLSYSMYKEGIRGASKAMKDFIDSFDLNNIKVGIIGFADRSKVLIEATDNKNKLFDRINQMERDVDDTILGAGTGKEPLSLGRKELGKFSEFDNRYLIILTDGVWDYKAKTDGLREKNNYINEGYEIVAMGFSTADETFIKKISTREELAKFDSIEALSKNMSRIAQVINEVKIR